VNGEKYSDMIRHQLKLAIRRKRLCVSSSGVYLQHHNSRLRTARHTVKQIQGLQIGGVTPSTIFARFGTQ